MNVLRLQPSFISKSHSYDWSSPLQANLAFVTLDSKSDCTTITKLKINFKEPR